MSDQVNVVIHHYCKGALPGDAYGDAINECWEAPLHGQEKLPKDLSGTFWVGNGEYWSQVNFCPYCGAKAPVQAALFSFQHGEWKERE